MFGSFSIYPRDHQITSRAMSFVCVDSFVRFLLLCSLATWGATPPKQYTVAAATSVRAPRIFMFAFSLFFAAYLAWQSRDPTGRSTTLTLRASLGYFFLSFSRSGLDSLGIFAPVVLCQSNSSFNRASLTSFFAAARLFVSPISSLRL